MTESAVTCAPEGSVETKGHTRLIQKVEKQARDSSDALSHLRDRVPKPCADALPRTHLALEACALLTREFNAAMGLPVGSAHQCLPEGLSMAEC